MLLNKPEIKLCFQNYIAIRLWNRFPGVFYAKILKIGKNRKKLTWTSVENVFGL